MAAYAALVSLLNTVEQINSLNQKIQLYDPLCSLVYNTDQVESLGEKTRFLLDFIEANDRSRGGGKAAAADLEAMITSAAHAAEDEIESRVLDHIEAAPINRRDKHPPMILSLDLQTILEEMDRVKENVTKFKQENESKPPTYEIPATSSSSRPDQANNTEDERSGSMIGFDEELNQLLEILFGWESSRKITPVQGMGGIGKTTLARNTYRHPTVVNHFDMRAWATVSQTYTRKTVLLEILKSCGSPSSDSEDEQILGVKLHKILSGRRYLLVLDDVWTAEALEDMLSFFPDNNNGSRIVITTRLSNMGTHFGSPSLSMNLLDEGKSWDLLREKAFCKEAYLSPQLERIGKQIANKCKGLPLSITVIGRLLGESSMTEEYWSSVANDMNSILNSGEEDNVLSLSYTHLPARLKPCFLYMGVFPEDQVVDVWRLIILWIAEGFLKPNESQSLEETAESQLMEVLRRNLILAHEWDIGSGKLKSFIIHDLLRDLSLRIAEKQNFLRAINSFSDTIDRQDVARDRRLVIHASIPSVVLKIWQSASLVRSLFHHDWERAHFAFRLLRVLEGDCSADYLRNVMSSTFNIRYLFCNGNPSEVDGERQFRPSMSRTYWPNLQMLCCGNEIYLGMLEIWDTMPQLRHLFGRVILLPDPARDPEAGFSLPYLQSLGTVKNLRLSEELCKRIPNVRILELRYSSKYQGGYKCLGYLCRFEKLERLSLEFSRAHFDSLPPNLKLPSSLRELILESIMVGWEDLSVIGLLPNLRVLQLNNLKCNEYEWNPVEGQFPELKYLSMNWCDELIRWNADSCHFPVLEKLHMNGLPNLEEIPLGFGDTPTLRIIRLEGCNVRCGISALNILEEQESLGNEDLHVRIRVLHDHPEEVREMLAEKVGSLETNAKKNLQLELVGCNDEKIRLA